MSIVVMFQEPLNRDPMHGSTPLARSLTLISAGYFIVDGAIIGTRFHEHGLEPLSHAIICVTYFFYEISTPFVQTRWFMYSLGYQNTRAYKINGLAMIGAFFGARVVWGTSALSTYDQINKVKIMYKLPPSYPCKDLSSSPTSKRTGPIAITMNHVSGGSCSCGDGGGVCVFRIDGFRLQHIPTLLSWPLLSEISLQPASHATCITYA
jgi:hypothetical protein